MMRRLSSVLILVMIAVLSLASVAQADGIIVPDPPCENFDCNSVDTAGMCQRGALPPGPPAPEADLSIRN